MEIVEAIVKMNKIEDSVDELICTKSSEMTNERVSEVELCKPEVSDVNKNYDVDWDFINHIYAGSSNMQGPFSKTEVILI